MPGLVIGGAERAVPGLAILNWHDDARLRLKLGEDARERRTSWVRAIILHTTKGIPGGRDHRPQKILPGLGPDVGAELRTARFWSSDPTPSGAHLVVDHDGSIACLADLRTEKANHAGRVNDVTIGIELYQGGDAELYEGQLDACVLLVDALTALFGIQRQIHQPYRANRPLQRLELGGEDCVGIFGHRDVTDHRGPGDPGDQIFELLRHAGYESFDFARAQDREVWKGRQRGLAGVAIDGIPGPGTTKALTSLKGLHRGLWVVRPVDAGLALS